MTFHVLKEIIGTKSNVLEGQKVILCITGSVSAIKSPEIARELMRNGAEVYPVMTENAKMIINPYTMEWATGNPCITQLTGKVEHVMLAGEHKAKADLLLIAPSTANTIGKIANGIDDTTVTTFVSTAFGAKIPIMIVPAMHESIYKHPIVLDNIKLLEALGIDFIGPRIEEGKAKIADTEEIIGSVISKLSTRKDLDKQKFVVTAGPTFEYIDPVRIITNQSSGKMGMAIAEEALSRGAKVTIIYGPGSAKPPLSAKVINVKTTKEMFDAVVEELRKEYCNCFIAAAACADWMPEDSFTEKVSTHTTKYLEIRLVSTPKIIDTVKTISPKTFLVAFKAEHGLSDEALINSAHERLVKANADLVVANDVSREGVGFKVDTNEVFIVDQEKVTVHVPLASKREVAKKLIDVILNKLS